MVVAGRTVYVSPTDSEANADFDVPSASMSSNGTIILKLRPNPIGIFLRLLKPYVSLDGVEQERGWQAREFSVEPGSHSVTVLLRYRRAGRNPRTITVDVAAGQTVTVQYAGPALDIGVGRIYVKQ